MIGWMRKFNKSVYNSSTCMCELILNFGVHMLILEVVRVDWPNDERLSWMPLLNHIWLEGVAHTTKHGWFYNGQHPLAWIWWENPPNYANHNSSQSYRRSETFNTNLGDLYFMKENACKMIRWKPRIKIHNPTTHIWFKINSPKLSLIWQHKIKFLIHTL